MLETLTVKQTCTAPVSAHDLEAKLDNLGRDPKASRIRRKMRLRKATPAEKQWFRQWQKQVASLNDALVPQAPMLNRTRSRRVIHETHEATITKRRAQEQELAKILALRALRRAASN